MKYSVCLLLIVLAAKPAFAAEKFTLTSESLKEFIEKKNQRVLAKDEEVKAAQSREGALARSFLPAIEIYGAQENFKLGSKEQKTQPAYGAEAKVNLFNGGKDSLFDRKARLTSERRQLEKKITLTEELTKARALFWSIAYLRDSIQLLKQSMSLNSENLKSADRRIRSGVATRSDRVEFEMKETDLKQDLGKAETEYKSQVKSLAALLGVPLDSELVISQTLQHEHNWESQIQHSHEDHEFLSKPSEISAQEKDLEVKAHERGYWPKVDAYAGWNQYNQREEDLPEAEDRRETVIGLKMTLALSDIVTARSETAAQRAEAKSLKLESEYLRREIESHYHAEFAEIQTLHSQVHEAEENIKRAETYYSLTQSEYARGVKNSPDVLGATEKLFDIKRKHLEIIRDFQITKAHLLSKMGK